MSVSYSWRARQHLDNERGVNNSRDGDGKMAIMTDVKTLGGYIATFENTLPDPKPIFVLLGGTYGVGKTTIAHHLGIEMSIMQRVGLGGITKTIRTVLPEDEVVKGWHHYDRSDREQVRAKLRRESQLIGRVISTILDSAEKSGESYIIDGVQLLPEFLPMSKLHMFLLAVPDQNEHRQRFEHPTITRTRHLNNSTFDLARIVESIILEESQPYGIPIISNLSSPKETAMLIKTMLVPHLNLMAAKPRIGVGPLAPVDGIANSGYD